MLVRHAQQVCLALQFTQPRAAQEGGANAVPLGPTRGGAATASRSAAAAPRLLREIAHCAAKETCAP